MSLTSGSYLVFLFVVFFAYWLVAARPSLRVGFLVGAFLVFYAAAGPLPLLALLALAAADFVITRALARSDSKPVRRALLWTSVGCDVGALVACKALGWPAPLGLSFFVFQSLALVAGVYRRDSEPAPTFLDHLAFVAFFPTLTAGPILRPRHLLAQLRGPVELPSGAGGEALWLVARGLVKKLLIADYLGVNLVDRVFDLPERFSSLEVLLAVYAYALQLHADFSGCTDVARGSALLLGFRLPENSDRPYVARSLPEFWRRWHISLSTWLRDHVFFPLAVGGRGATPYLALVATMLLGGIWHGVSWTFVAWGALHGLGLATVRLWQTWRGPRRATWQGGLGTFHFVCLGWILFRADSVTQAGELLGQLAAGSTDTSNVPAAVLLVMAVAAVAHVLPERPWERLREQVLLLPAPLQAGLLLALGVGLRQVATSDVVPFIYARF